MREAHGLGTKTKARLQKIQNSYIREMNNTTGRFPADLSHNVQQYVSSNSAAGALTSVQHQDRPRA